MREAFERTALEARTVSVRRKAFLFVTARDLRLKLRDSLGEAGGNPGVRVGAHGWTTVTGEVESGTLERWVRESWSLCGGSAGK